MTHPSAARSPVQAIWERLLDFVFPKRCVGCGAWDTFLCAACDAAIVRLHPPFCFSCGDTLAPPETPAGVCAGCRAGAPAFLDGARSAFRFSGAAREAVHALKYDGVTAIAPLLAAAVAAAVAATPWRVDIVVPVPLHPSRRRERGYNQAEELARAVAAQLGLTLVTNALQRTRATTSQTQLDQQARRANLAGAFVWRAPELGGRQVLLIDDVMTTGATLDACAAALKVAGAGAVYAATAARA